MKQRLAIAAALIGNPDVLIFDEPTNGLDPQGIAEVRDSIKSIAATGKTVIMASHILDEVEKICSHVAIIKNGKLLATGTVGSILNQNTQVEIAVSDMSKLKEIVNHRPGITIIKEMPERFLLEIEENISVQEISESLFKNNLIITHLVARNRTLEEEFLEITK
jgi:ABC-2 type transport system ATP-binding protein